MLICWVLFPLVLSALALGCGLLLERAAGARLSGVLLLPAGFAVIVVVAQLLTMVDLTAELAAPVVVVLAAAGIVLSPPWRDRQLDAWALGSAAAVFAVFAAPVVLSGEATFAGYLKNEDTATWLALTDHAMEHGRSVSGLEPSAYKEILDRYLGSGYPLGVFLPLGVARPLVGQDLAWVFQSYMALLAAMLALALYALAAPVIASRPLRALAVFIAAQSALVFGNSLFGEPKELAAAGILAFLAVLVPSVVRDPEGGRRLLPIAAGSAAFLGILSVGGGVWLLPMLLAALATTISLRGFRPAVARAATFVAFTVALSVPSLVVAGEFLGPASNVLTAGSELGNLNKPLSGLQLFGIWPAGDFRTTPDDLTAAHLLIAILGVSAVLGLAWAWRNRAWSVLLYTGTVLIGCLIIVFRGSPWVDAKALATASPAVVLAGMVGAVAVFGSGRRWVAGLFAAAIAGGVLWSNVLAYHEVDLAPRDRLGELQKIGERIAGQGPALTTEYEFFGVRHFLRDADPVSASIPGSHETPLLGGSPAPEGTFADIDDFGFDGVITHRTIVLRRSPVGSRPPSPYRLIWRGRYYEAWQRPKGPGSRVVAHLSLGNHAVVPLKGETPTPAYAPLTLEPGGKPGCGDVARLARAVGGRGGLVAVPDQPRVVADLSQGSHPSGWGENRQAGALLPGGAGTSEARVSVAKEGRYSIWLGGSFRGRLEARMDGKLVRVARHELSYSPGQYIPMGEVFLDAGPHRVELHYDGTDLHPGSGGPEIAPFGAAFTTPFELGPLLLRGEGLEDRQMFVIRALQARALCGRRLDWIEALGPG